MLLGNRAKERSARMSHEQHIVPRTLEELEACLKKTLDRLEKGELPGLVVSVDNVPKSRDWLLDRVRLELSFMTAVKDAKIAWETALRKRKGRKPGVVRLVNDLLVGLNAELGRKSEKLLDWGFRPKKERRKATSDELKESVDQARATKAANRKRRKGR